VLRNYSSTNDLLRNIPVSPTQGHDPQLRQRNRSTLAIFGRSRRRGSSGLPVERSTKKKDRDHRNSGGGVVPAPGMTSIADTCRVSAMTTKMHHDPIGAIQRDKSAFDKERENFVVIAETRHVSAI